MARLSIAALIAVFLVASSAFGQPRSSGAGPFAISFHAENWRKCPSTGPLRCVLGKLSNDQPLQLLGSERSVSCSARTERSFESKWESGSFPITYVGTANCPEFNFRLSARTNRSLRYQLLSAASLPGPEPSTKQEIEDAVRRAASGLEPSSPHHALELLSTSPAIFKLPNMAQETYVAVFENSATPGDQVHFLYVQGRVKLIHSAAKISSIFLLGDTYFIHYKFTCRHGCGYWGDIVVKFTSNDFQVVLFDDSTAT